jgi:abortive infection bacteriophage resistance protein
MAYEKPWLSVQDQLALLTQQGLQIDDQRLASACLERIGYYRLSGYMYAFRKRTDPIPRKDDPTRSDRLVLNEFRAGSRLQDCVDLYVFDKKLRGLVLDALERVEIALRVDIAHLLGRRNAFAYLSAKEFHKSFQDIGKHGKTKHANWLKKQEDLIERSNEEFIAHNQKIGPHLAIWVSCEVWDFGTMSTIYNHMLQDDQDAISQRYGISNGRVVASWLQTFNQLRNICAHHSRLWNRNISRRPRLPPARDVQWVTKFMDQEGSTSARSFLTLMMLIHVLKRINPNSSWSTRVRDHLLGFPNLEHVELNVAGMGAPLGWAAMLEA